LDGVGIGVELPGGAGIVECMDDGECGCCFGDDSGGGLVDGLCGSGVGSRVVVVVVVAVLVDPDFDVLSLELE
jgi:hypothetical protein